MEKAVKHYFYVLYCADNTFYGGYTTDLERREKEHQSQMGAKYTRPSSRHPLALIYAEVYNSRVNATKAEYRFKKLTRRQKERYLADKGIDSQYHLVDHYILVEGEEDVDATTKELSDE